MLLYVVLCVHDGGGEAWVENTWKQSCCHRHEGPPEEHPSCSSLDWSSSLELFQWLWFNKFLIQKLVLEVKATTNVFLCTEMD